MFDEDIPSMLEDTGTKDGNKAVSYPTVCDKCLKRYKKEGLILETEKEEEMWLLGNEEEEAWLLGNDIEYIKSDKLQIAIEALEFYKRYSNDSRNLGLITTKIKNRGSYHSAFIYRNRPTCSHKYNRYEHTE